jgi:hypothetical protein
MRGFLSGWGIRILIIAIIAGGAFIFRDRLGGNAGDLQVGDCFDEPAQETETVEDVQHHPCNESHTAEVVFVGNYAGATDTYPTDDQFVSAVLAQCVPAFNSYTGRDFQSDQELDLGYFVPTADGWGGGDHEMICYAVRLDEAPSTTSVKAGG